MSARILLTVSVSFLLTGLSAQIFVNHNVSPAEINVEHLDENVNSKASDLAAVRYGDRVYFTSTRKQSGDENLPVVSIPLPKEKKPSLWLK